MQACPRPARGRRHAPQDGARSRCVPDPLPPDTSKLHNIGAARRAARDPEARAPLLSRDAVARTKRRARLHRCIETSCFYSGDQGNLRGSTRPFFFARNPLLQPCFRRQRSLEVGSRPQDASSKLLWMSRCKASRAASACSPTASMAIRSPDLTPADNTPRMLLAFVVEPWRVRLRSLTSQGKPAASSTNLAAGLACSPTSCRTTAWISGNGTAILVERSGYM